MILAHRHTLYVWLTGIFLFLFLASCPPAVGYRVKEFKWDTADFPVKYWIDPDIEVGGEWVISASTITQAFQRWSDVPTSSFEASYQGIKEGVNSSDGECHVMLYYEEGDVITPPTILTTLLKSWRLPFRGRVCGLGMARDLDWRLEER